MEKMQYYPFKRNRYFWGKLLSARDFQSEQCYFNSKRYFLNRLLWSGGILFGLFVEQTDEQSISVEMGAALDYLGREVVLDRHVIKKLSLFDDFLQAPQNGYMYLCIEYDEKEEEPAYSALNASEATYYNKCREGCRLFLTEEEGLKSLQEEEDRSRADMNALFEVGGHLRIYLARIYYEANQNNYAISRIENVPFGQYAGDWLVRKAVKQIQVEKKPEKPAVNLSRIEASLKEILKKNLELTLSQPVAASGITEIEIGRRGGKNSAFFSRDIVHGLGEGQVQITLGQIGEEGSLFYGSGHIFEKYGMPLGLVHLEMGARVNMKEGTFQIGIKLLSHTDKEIVRIAWNACKDSRQDKPGHGRKSLVIKPEIARVRCGEEFCFRCEVIGMAAEKILWQVNQNQGGSIDGEGLYKAPEAPGIYSIKASLDGIGGKAYVIVQ